MEDKAAAAGELAVARVPLSQSSFRPVMGQALRDFVTSAYHVGNFFMHTVDLQPFFIEGADAARAIAYAALAGKLSLTGVAARVITIIGNNSVPSTRAATIQAAAGAGQPRPVIPPGWRQFYLRRSLALSICSPLRSRAVFWCMAGATLQAPFTPIADKTLPDKVQAALVGFIAPILAGATANPWASALPGYLDGVTMSAEQIAGVKAVPPTPFGSASDESWLRQRLVQRVGSAAILDALLVTVAFPTGDDQARHQSRKLILTSLLDYFNRGVGVVWCAV